MNLSNFYARLFGFYLVIMSLGIFFKPQPLHDLLTQANANITMTALGILTLIFGLAIVVSHQKWHGWPIIITVLGYWIVIKGIILVFYPELILKMVDFAWQGNHLLIAVGIDLALGIILLYLGFKMTASN